MGHHGYAQLTLEPIFGFALALAIFLYIGAVFFSNKRHSPWPVQRTVLWVLGVFCAGIALVGPVANAAHGNFVYHTIGHLLLGMLAPLLLVLAAPVSLLLRTLPVYQARQLTRILRSGPVRLLSHPITAALLNIGGLYILYRTPLYMSMQHHMWLHVLVHLHVFLAGFLFTASIIYIDPVAHRLSFLYRSAVLIAALAAHGILSKSLYAFPPAGIAKNEAELGGMLMYYGGDLVDVVLIAILCYQWYKATRRPPQPLSSSKKGEAPIG
ncbi:cytochrome c oxidase assembly protein [Planococcus sp. YIM B11945]|uniref:cytochrome c oxidase assembly protein n=1 Tax=Planococcus sp. YIM B11945 TaxID=3435410 RepID=UPI003D7D5AB3